MMLQHKSLRKGYLMLVVLLLHSACFQAVFGQDTTRYKLRLTLTLLDLPQNFQGNGSIPSMMQSVELANDLYDISFWGIDALGNVLFPNRKNTTGGKIARIGFDYLLGLAFSQYGSELPIPLGVYCHEEFHRSVLGDAGYSALNGNWIFNRWDGTVYGITDANLSELKQQDISKLLYSYVSGVQSENVITQVNVIQDFYHSRKFYKSPLYLYNAYYVWNYFRFSVSAESDSVKVLAPEHEDKDPYYRDFAGADLTAWVFDMFSPETAYTDRDPFPEGDGVNRRIGFGDLTTDAGNFLKKQKNLALLNFVNPAIFMIHRIRISEDFDFLPFLQYSPTHFGNDIALLVPFRLKSQHHLGSFHLYHNGEKAFAGFQYGLYNIKPVAGNALSLGATLSVWNQPETQSYFDESAKLGGSFEIQADYLLFSHFSARIAAGYKSVGWMIGNPYLGKTAMLQLGFSFNLPQ